jgi:hypothetical protein
LNDFLVEVENECVVRSVGNFVVGVYRDAPDEFKVIM